ncbi:LOW QUALITY PROTEIN: uncharacterized protein LOC143361500 [Halictus rubicundus]|uniref:LOW QUALITY PROTEIN: uncharacterized protein LOC143361500 n=1 Tax=Halictus rubicundus TaxID=77578 RepID=UPI0040360DCE
MSEPSKTLALVLTAIKNLREIKGSTTREILRYLCSAYDIPLQVARRQMQAVLKRGVAYGILKNNGGHYVLPLNSDTKGEEIASQEINLLDFCRKKRSRKPACKCKKKQRRRRRCRRRKQMKPCKCKKKRRREEWNERRGCQKKRRRRSTSCRRRRNRKCRCGGLGISAIGIEWKELRHIEHPR